MPTLRLLAAAVLPLLLSGCYTSTMPLITAAQAVFPYQKIVYAQSGDTTMTTLTHTGNAYVATDDKGNTTDVLFMPVSGAFYVVQFHLTTDQGDGYLYGLLKLDATAKTAAAYDVVATKDDIAAGLPACKNPDGTLSDDTVCLATTKDLQAYITRAMMLANSGEAPDTTYTLSELDK